MIEKAVTSVAVPEVEEMAQKWALVRSFGRPKTLHMSSKVVSGYSYLIHMALAASMGEPPPMATIQSGWNSCMTAAPFMTVSTEGSDSTPSMSLTSMPADSRSAWTSWRKPPRFMEPPPQTMTARLPSKFFTSWRAPSPKYRSRGLVKRPMQKHFPSGRQLGRP